MEVMAGNDRMLHRFNVEHDVCYVRGTVIHVVVNGTYAGYVVISDEIKEDAELVMRELKLLGIKKTVMLTGDNEEVAKEVARLIGMDEVYAELLPEEKVRIVEGELDGKLP